MSQEELQFVTKRSLLDNQNEELRRKIQRLGRTLIGRKLGVKETTRFERIPLTKYEFYSDFFQSKIPEALMFPQDQYEECMTTGTMGVPKRILLSKPYIMDVLRTIRAAMLTATYREGRPTFEKGDLLYANLAPRPFVSGVFTDYVASELSSFIKLVPLDQTRPFQEKTQYFVDHHKDISIAWMPLVMLLHQVYPKIGGSLKLKGFIPFDTAAEAYKDRVKEIVGCNLSGVYVSTETCLSVVFSPEHELGFVFDPRLMKCEFLPMQEAPGGHRSPGLDVLIPLEEVKKGQKYKLIITPFKGELTRYDTEDVVEVVDYGDSILGTDFPVLKFVSRAQKVIIINNFAIVNEAELLLVLSRAQIPYVDFTARLEVEEGRQFLSVYLEPVKQLSVSELKEKIHQSLLALDSPYESLTRFYEYEPLRVRLLPQGSFGRLLATKKGNVKIDRINMKENDFRFLLESQ